MYSDEYMKELSDRTKRVECPHCGESKYYYECDSCEMFVETRVASLFSEKFVGVFRRYLQGKGKVFDTNRCSATLCSACMDDLIEKEHLK